jgi:hypothetical protein
MLEKIQTLPGAETVQVSEVKTQLKDLLAKPEPSSNIEQVGSMLSLASNLLAASLVVTAQTPVTLSILTESDAQRQLDLIHNVALLVDWRALAMDTTLIRDNLSTNIKSLETRPNNFIMACLTAMTSVYLRHFIHNWIKQRESNPRILPTWTHTEIHLKTENDLGVFPSDQLVWPSKDTSESDLTVPLTSLPRVDDLLMAASNLKYMFIKILSGESKAAARFTSTMYLSKQLATQFASRIAQHKTGDDATIPAVVHSVCLLLSTLAAYYGREAELNEFDLKTFLNSTTGVMTNPELQALRQTLGAQYEKIPNV